MNKKMSIYDNLKIPLYKLEGSLSPNIFSSYHPHLRVNQNTELGNKIKPIKIESWDIIQEDFGRRPYYDRPTITFIPTDYFLHHGRNNQNIVKVKITGTNTHYDMDLWGTINMIENKYCFLVLRTIFSGYPKLKGYVTLLDQYTVENVPSEMKKVISM